MKAYIPYGPHEETGIVLSEKNMNTGITSLTSGADGFLSGARGFLANDPMFSMLLLIVAAIRNTISNARGFRGGVGGAAGGTAGKAKALIVVIILVLIIPFIALLFSGATTGSTGLYGNATISYAVRQSTYNFSQFLVLILVLGALGIVLALL